MNVLLRTAVALAGAAVAVVAAALPATAAGGSSLSPNDACANPVLAQNASGWTASRSGRIAITGHPAARFAFRVTASSSSATMTLPAQTVSTGQRWTFAADSQINGKGGKVAVTVEFYSGSGKRLTRTAGAKVGVGGASWTRAAVTATAPSGAVRAVVTQAATLTKGALWSSTACDYVPPAGVPTTTTQAPPTTSPPATTAPVTTVPATTTAPSSTITPVPPTTPPSNPATTTPTPTTTTGPPPFPAPGDGTQAAAGLGWGAPVDGDEFDGAALDTTKWGVYDSPGHGGKGLRRPSQITVANGVLTMSGTANGTTGGMEFRSGRRYGRWETRMQVPHGDARYHPVLILWPDAEDWPVGGEVDYAETTASATKVEFFLHFSQSDQQTTAAKTVDITQWHNYAVEWTSTGVRGYVDGQLFFTDTNPAHLPPRSMHQTMQLDWFPKGSTATTPSSMNVAWTRYYPV